MNKKFTVVIANPTEPIGLGMACFGGVITAAYDRELSNAQPAVAVNEQDELQPAANWIYNGLRPCEISDIQEFLMLGFNRAKRLYDSAKAAAEAAKGGE
jgi:hypothetical protein